MNKILLTLLVAISIPFLVSAHTEDTTNSQDSGFRMMQQIEDQALGDELHEEIEDLMIKMMAGDLSEAEADRMVEFIDQYPGPGSMMISRIMGMGTFGLGFNNFNKNSMMGLHGFGGGLLMILFWVLVIVGIVALVKYMMGDRKSESSKSALDILNERYAKGELDKNEYEAKKKDFQR